jgi:xylulokinase
VVSILGIDLGTGSVKAAVVADGRVLSKRSCPYAVRSPHPGWAESDPEEWLAATIEVAEGVLGDQPADRVGFSGQMHGVVLVDEALQPLRPAIIWADARSTAQAERMSATLTSEALSRLGSPAVAGFAATTLAWLAENEPDVLGRARYALQPKDWLRARLGGTVMTDPSDASGTLLCDVASGAWSVEALAWAGVPADLMAPIGASSADAGTILLGGRELAAVVGGADTACALTGLGLVAGEGFLAVGSGAQVVRVMDQPILDPSLRTHTFAAAGEPASSWYRIGAMQSAGLSLTPTLAMLDATVEEAARALAEGVRDGDPIFVPYLAGERTPFMDQHLRGSWTGLSLGTDRSSLLRSVLEGVAQAVALGVTAVQESGAVLPDAVPLVGGGTHDPAFRQLLADATGLALEVTDAPDAAVVGAALLAEGTSANPNPPSRLGRVEPRPESAAMLAERRARMVGIALDQEAP